VSRDVDAGRRGSHRVLHLRGGPHLADDAEDGQLQDDHHRPADEQRLRGVLLRLRMRGATLGPGSRRTLAARLQRARAARDRDPGNALIPALLGSFLAMMATGVPVAIAMAGSALIYSLLTGDVPPFVVIHRMVSGIDSFPLLAVPFFIMAGNLMNHAGITNRIYNFALSLVGWLKGGLGHVNIIGSVIFAGMSGTAIADAAGLGTIELKAMRDHGYDMGFSVGVTAASATLGPIIPPSLPFVIYGMMANVS